MGGFFIKNKIQYISTQVYNGTLQAQFTYGPNRNRTVMEVGLDGGTSYTKYYAGKLYACLPQFNKGMEELYPIHIPFS